MKLWNRKRTYYCSDCGDDWETDQRETEWSCTQCNSTNIKETTDGSN